MNTGAEQPRHAEKQREAWQQKLLPLMGAFVVVAALFFGVMSAFELRDLYSRIEHQPFDLQATFTEFEKSARREAMDDSSYIRFKVLALLEADALQRRYHQANATMLGRVWTRQLGFITGMLLALVGAAFILGRLREDVTRISAEGKGLKGALESSSPGIILATLGTLLIIMTIWIPFGVETRDVNTYLRVERSMTLPDPLPVFPQEREEAGKQGSGGGNAASNASVIERRERELFNAHGNQ